MARRRMIDPNIWQSEDFSQLSLLAKLIFIGMFSLADDYGKGRAKAIYLKSVLFPYDDGMRLIDVEKALSEIGSNMSVTFYTSNGNDYYVLNNWKRWQTVDKPQPSKIPDFESVESNSDIILESVANESRMSSESFEPKRKEEKRKEENAPGKPGIDARAENRFVKPTVEEVQEYCIERKNNVNAEQFVDHYDANGWKIGGKGAMKDWKAAIRTWEKNGYSNNGVNNTDIEPTLKKDAKGWLKR